MILGIDIGGKHVRGVFLLNDQVVGHTVVVAPACFGERELVYIPALEQIRDALGIALVDHLLVLSTATLSSGFTKGLTLICEAVENIFGNPCLHFLGNDGKFYNKTDALKNPEKVCCTEYWGTITFCSRLTQEKKYVLVDMGTQSTTILPVINGSIPTSIECTPHAAFRDGLLIMMGMIGTHVYSVVSSVQWNGYHMPINDYTPLLMCDLYFYEGILKSEEYILYRELSMDQIHHFLCNLVLVDFLTVDKAKTHELAKQIIEKQEGIISQHVENVCSGFSLDTVIVTGRGEGVVHGALKGWNKKVIYIGDLRPDVANNVPLIGAVYSLHDHLNELR
ncbi:MAG: hypothetical protein AABX52_03610 [Nanoarchaeota archaeon]